MEAVFPSFSRGHSYNVCTCTGDTVQRLAAGWGNHWPRNK